MAPDGCDGEHEWNTAYLRLTLPSSRTSIGGASMNYASMTMERIAPRFLQVLAFLVVAHWVLAQPGNRPLRNSPVVMELYDFVYDGIGLSGYSHGKVLYSELIQGADGNFYGTTVNGGSGGCADGF